MIGHGTLKDGTRWSLGLVCSCGHMPCRGGQHAGTGVPMVRLERDGWTLSLKAGLKSALKTRKAVQACDSWTEVPMGIEAAGLVMGDGS